MADATKNIFIRAQKPPDSYRDRFQTKTQDEFINNKTLSVELIHNFLFCFRYI